MVHDISLCIDPLLAKLTCLALPIHNTGQRWLIFVLSVCVSIWVYERRYWEFVCIYWVYKCLHWVYECRCWVFEFKYWVYILSVRVYIECIINVCIYFFRVYKFSVLWVYILSVWVSISSVLCVSIFSVLNANVKNQVTF